MSPDSQQRATVLHAPLWCSGCPLGLAAQNRGAGCGGTMGHTCPCLMLCFGSRLLSPRPSLLNTASDTRLNSSPQKPLDLKQLKQRAAAIPPIVSTLLERARAGSTACASCMLSPWAPCCASGLQGCAHPWGWPLVCRELCLGGASPPARQGAPCAEHVPSCWSSSASSIWMSLELFYQKIVGGLDRKSFSLPHDCCLPLL